MGMPALKQAVEEAREAMETAYQHMRVALPTFIAKQKDTMREIMDAIQDTDMAAASKASGDAVRKGLKGIDITDSKAITKAGDKAFRKSAGDGIVDTAVEGLKYLVKGEGGDMASRGLEVVKHSLSEVTDPENLTKLARTYYLAAKSKGADAAAIAALQATMFEQYQDTVAGTPAEDSALTEKEFDDMVKQGYKTTKSGHKLGKDMDADLKGTFGPNLMK